MDTFILALALFMGAIFLCQVGGELFNRPRLGTRSVLYGYHIFWLHWIIVALGWYKLYGFYKVPVWTKGRTTSLWDPRLWIAFIVHDLGYIGKPNMDGPEGEEHPYWGGFLMGFLFGEDWGFFTQYHSRFLSKRDGVQPSRLCFADKLAICLYPDWLYLMLIHLTGEVYEYMANAKRMIGKDGHVTSREWLRDVKVKAHDYAWAHRDGQEDTTTPKGRVAGPTGVYE